MKSLEWALSFSTFPFLQVSCSVYCLAVLSNISNPTMRTGLDFKSAPENVFLLMYIFRFIVLLLWTKKIMLLVWCHCLISYKYWSYIPQVWPAELPFFSNLVYMSIAQLSLQVFYEFAVESFAYKAGFHFYYTFSFTSVLWEFLQSLGSNYFQKFVVEMGSYTVCVPLATQISTPTV